MAETSGTPAIQGALAFIKGTTISTSEDVMVDYSTPLEVPKDWTAVSREYFAAKQTV